MISVYPIYGLAMGGVDFKLDVIYPTLYLSTVINVLLTAEFINPVDFVFK